MKPIDQKSMEEEPVVNLDRLDACQGHSQFGLASMARTVCAIARETGESPCAQIDAEGCGWWDRVQLTGAYYGGDISLGEIPDYLTHVEVRRTGQLNG